MGWSDGSKAFGVVYGGDIPPVLQTVLCSLLASSLDAVTSAYSAYSSTPIESYRRSRKRTLSFIYKGRAIDSHLPLHQREYPLSTTAPSTTKRSPDSTISPQNFNLRRT